ncbi:MAG: ABC transporter ATP-binding protein [Mycobacteriales bacterium]
MISVEGVSKCYFSAGREPLLVLDDVALSVGDGEFVGIIGPSGCGKTTLLKMLAGLEPWDRGRILVDGAPLSGPGPDRRMVFQDFALLPWRTVQQNVEFGLEVKGVPKQIRRARAAEVIRQAGLAGFEGFFPYQLSGGMQQRVGLARALAMQPKVLLLDEPLSSLDAQTRRGLIGDFVHLVENAGQGAVLVTHDMEEVVMMCDRVFVLSTGPARVSRVIDVGTLFPRPRAGALDQMRRSAEFLQLVEEIWSELSKPRRSDQSNEHQVSQNRA